ncbi:MAG: four helix bundle protein [Bacteroidetes bacterium]|nr:four helix bundle protein [Bacteroidota bacterium]
MNSEEIKFRTKKCAADIIRFVDALPRSESTTVIGEKIIRAATSVAANYSAACRARSKATFINKLGTVEAEAFDTLFWLDMLIESGKVSKENIAGLYEQVDNVVAIFSASHKSEKDNRYGKS